MPVKQVLKSRFPAKIWARDIEPTAHDQLMKLTQLPFIHKHVAVMPDVHAGMGTTIGTVIPTKGAIIPAAVGVDIGCGMMACCLALPVNEVEARADEVLSEIQRHIPTGRSSFNSEEDVGSWSEDAMPSEVRDKWHSDLLLGLHEIVEECPPITAKKVNDVVHLGTLGSGNHFIEVCENITPEDEHRKDETWVVIHSGSRGIGARIANVYKNIATKKCRQWFVDLPDKDLAYFPASEVECWKYYRAAIWAQRYAWVNREIMMSLVTKVLHKMFKWETQILDTVHCHHNYVDEEEHFKEKVFVTRKGAVRAREGDRGIIPGSMGAKTCITEGLGNKESFCSSSHGAGRVMSRREAKRRFDVETLKTTTRGVACNKTADVLDEIPLAYKQIHHVMEDQVDLVRTTHMLKQFVCVKGT